MILPHELFGDPECWGCLVSRIQPTHAEIVCNVCGSIVLTVPPADLGTTLEGMERSLAVCTETCPHYGEVNVFAGFWRMDAFVCEFCGEGVTASGNG